MNVSLYQQMNDSLNRLREAGFRILQVADTAKTSVKSPAVLDAAHRMLNSPPSASLITTTASDIDALGAIWGRQNAPFALPSALLELYRSAQSNGFFFSVAVLRGPTAGNKAGETVVMSCCRLHPIQQIQPVMIDDKTIESFNQAKHLQPTQPPSTSDQFFALSLAALPTSSTDSSSSPAATSNSPAGAAGGGGSSMADLAVDLGKGTVCDVLLRYVAAGGGAQDSPDVWGRYDDQLFFIAHRAEDYIRLGAIFCWVCGWQLCYAPCGPLPSAVPWMRLLAPAALAAALAAPS